MASSTSSFFNRLHTQKEFIFETWVAKLFDNDRDLEALCHRAIDDPSLREGMTNAIMIKGGYSDPQARPDVAHHVSSYLFKPLSKTLLLRFLLKISNRPVQGSRVMTNHEQESKIKNTCQRISFDPHKTLYFLCKNEIKLRPPTLFNLRGLQTPLAGDLAGILTATPAPIFKPPAVFSAADFKKLFRSFVKYIACCNRYNDENTPLYKKASQLMSVLNHESTKWEWPIIFAAFQTFLPIEIPAYDGNDFNNATLSTAAGNAIMLLSEDRFNEDSYKFLMEPIEIRLKGLHSKFTDELKTFNKNKRFFKKQIKICPDWLLKDSEYRFLAAAVTCMRLRVAAQQEDPMEAKSERAELRVTT